MVVNQQPCRAAPRYGPFRPLSLKAFEISTGTRSAVCPLKQSENHKAINALLPDEISRLRVHRRRNNSISFRNSDATRLAAQPREEFTSTFRTVRIAHSDDPALSARWIQRVDGSHRTARMQLAIICARFEFVITTIQILSVRTRSKITLSRTIELLSMTILPLNTNDICHFRTRRH